MNLEFSIMTKRDVCSDFIKFCKMGGVGQCYVGFYSFQLLTEEKAIHLPTYLVIRVFTLRMQQCK